jgi:DNA polymerase-3 subunit beta
VRLGLLPAEEFPALPIYAAEPAFTSELDAGGLLRVLKFCGHAASEEETRYYICGIQLSADGIACATDGHRLALHRLKGLKAPEKGVILPVPACKRLQALLRDVNDPVVVTITPRLATFAAGQWQLSSKLVDGTFPDYRRLLPDRSAAPVVIDRAAFAAAIARVGLICTGPGKKSRRASLAVAGGDFTVSGGELQASIDEVIAVVSGGNASVTTGANIRYFAEALGVLEGDQVELHLGDDPRDALWLCDAGEEHDGVVIMPMRE